MKIWDSELLTKSKIEPVTDGLIFWLDARDTFYGDTQLGSYNPPVWKNAHMFDRVYGIRVDFQPAYGQTRGVKQEGSFICSLVPTGTGAVDCKGVIETTINNIVTVEIVADDPKRVFSDNVVPWGGKLQYPYQTNPTAQADLSLISGNYPHIICTFVNNGSKTPPAIFQNGVRLTNLSSSNGAKHSTTRAAYFNGAGAETHYFGCVRFYNRALTEEEILQNLEYEKSIGRVVL